MDVSEAVLILGILVTKEWLRNISVVELIQGL
jgi:hypothetical protein